MPNPTINGRYRILQQIGVGGFGLTYLAEDLQLETRPKTVVKHLRPQITDAETLELANRLFQQEAEILYRLGGHPNIPSLIAHFRERGEFFLVQEFIEGHTLDREFTGGKKYNQKEIIQFLGQTLEILSFVHSQKVIHRDVKPANLIRRNSDGNIFLIDFGAVKQVGTAPRAADTNPAISGVTIGSHGYMPVEQMAGNPNFSSDLYALGLIAIEALTGIKPLDLPRNGNMGEFVWTHKAQLSPELERFVSKLVRMDFRQRFASANEALSALNAIAANIGFFTSRPQASAVMTLKPIAAKQNFPPLAPPVTSSFVPPTVIVPTQNSAGASRGFQNNASVKPKKSSGLAGFLTVFGILALVGFLCVAGKVLNFRWSSLTPADEPEISSSSERNLPISGTLNLYNEALKQAEEAKIKEKKATTKFEWEEIRNNYNRAYGLLSSINSESPDYEKAQSKIAEYKGKAEYALARATNSPDKPLPNETPTPAGNTTTIPLPTASTSPAKVKLTMPPKPSAQNYLTYNFDNGYQSGKTQITSDEVRFSSKIETNSYSNRPDSDAVVISAGSTRIKFKPPFNMTRLKPGSYSAVQESSYEPLMSYSISLDQFYCSQGSSHNFTIGGIVYDELYQNVSYLDATFTLNCGNRKLIGRVHYDAR